MIFLKKLFFSEQIVTFRSVFGLQVKNMCLFGKIVSPVLLELHFTCPVEHVERKATIAKKMLIFCTLSKQFFSHLWHNFPSGSQNCVLRVCTNTLVKKNWDLWFERIFFTLVRNFAQGWQTCILHVQGTVLNFCPVDCFEKKGTQNKNFSFLKFRSLNETFVDFSQKNLRMFVKTTFKVSRGTFSEKYFFD